ncbi:hypothetical protein B0H13DRAFT_1921704 [Mycena leptocephala]|nr:hypothetical protein B0H13DRAFT_1921704 [Mycena leptocephala]
MAKEYIHCCLFLQQSLSRCFLLPQKKANVTVGLALLQYREVQNDVADATSIVDVSPAPSSCNFHETAKGKMQFIEADATSTAVVSVAVQTLLYAVDDANTVAATTTSPSTQSPVIENTSSVTGERVKIQRWLLIAGEELEENVGHDLHWKVKNRIVKRVQFGLETESELGSCCDEDDKINAKRACLISAQNNLSFAMGNPPTVVTHPSPTSEAQRSWDEEVRLVACAAIF